MAEMSKKLLISGSVAVLLAVTILGLLIAKDLSLFLIIFLPALAILVYVFYRIFRLLKTIGKIEKELKETLEKMSEELNGNKDSK